MQAVLAGREAHIYGRSFFLPRKPTRGLGGKGSEYLWSQSLISSECPGLLGALNGHEGDKPLSSKSGGGGGNPRTVGQREGMGRRWGQGQLAEGPS